MNILKLILYLLALGAGFVALALMPYGVSSFPSAGSLMYFGVAAGFGVVAAGLVLGANRIRPGEPAVQATGPQPDYLFGLATEVTRISEISGDSDSIETTHYSKVRVDWESGGTEFVKFYLDVSPGDRIGLARLGGETIAQANLNTNRRYLWNHKLSGTHVFATVLVLLVLVPLAGVALIPDIPVAGRLAAIAPLALFGFWFVRSRSRANARGLVSDNASKELLARGK